MKLLGFMLAVVSGVASAATLSVSWTNPVLNVDGSTIPASGPGSLTGTRVEYGSCSGAAFGSAVGEVVAAAPAEATSFTGIGPGTYCVRAFARNTYFPALAPESAASNVYSKVVPAPVPAPPIVVTVETFAYEVQVKPSGVRVVQVGTVPLGVACGAEVASGYYEIDPAVATLRGSYKGGLLVARCA